MLIIMLEINVKPSQKLCCQHWYLGTLALLDNKNIPTMNFSKTVLRTHKTINFLSRHCVHARGAAAAREVGTCLRACAIEARQ